MSICYELRDQKNRNLQGIEEAKKWIVAYNAKIASFSYVVYTDFQAWDYVTYREAKANYDLLQPWQPTLHPIVSTAEFYNALIYEQTRLIEKTLLWNEDIDRQMGANNCDAVLKPPTLPPSQGGLVRLTITNAADKDVQTSVGLVLKNRTLQTMVAPGFVVSTTEKGYEFQDVGVSATINDASDLTIIWNPEYAEVFTGYLLKNTVLSPVLIENWAPKYRRVSTTYDNRFTIAASSTYQLNATTGTELRIATKGCIWKEVGSATLVMEYHVSGTPAVATIVAGAAVIPDICKGLIKVVSRLDKVPINVPVRIGEESTSTIGVPETSFIGTTPFTSGELDAGTYPIMVQYKEKEFRQDAVVECDKVTTVTFDWASGMVKKGLLKVRAMLDKLEINIPFQVGDITGTTPFQQEMNVGTYRVTGSYGGQPYLKDVVITDGQTTEAVYSFVTAVQDQIPVTPGVIPDKPVTPSTKVEDQPKLPVLPTITPSSYQWTFPFIAALKAMIAKFTTRGKAL